MIATNPPTPRIGFIGAGNLATSLIGGLIQAGWSPDSLCAADPADTTRRQLTERYGLLVSPENQDIVHQADVVVLAVKPQVMQPVARALAEAIRPTQTVVSVAAGIEGPALSRWLASTLGTPGIIRAMPNTPALLGAGATGLVAVNAVSEMGRSTTESIFAAVGTVEWLEREADLNAVIAVAGSAPAYFFAFIEALTRGGTNLGLPQTMAERLAIQTALGAARMASETDVPVQTLRERVTSPGGTTAEALKALQAGDLDALVRKAMQAAVDRAGAMADEFGASD
ncbi:pyrroline-5-carboxylate reductase [Abyssibacter profundi]|uniref:Pyrroline-5-carboxylate reductase n=1 Tax=Abyssibacter profundi TaxID=2182787 RepID=A0A363UNS6_9GAMM|nr:pyrroline-5-carboxylate reductase [Abyssibacter profundi]PWN57110.1 pyrroline-5-carboxylate reductase [Abyssibacter profundi]